MKLAFLGTGLMGYPMAEKLLEAGHSLTVYNRTREKAEPLQATGAVIVDQPASAFQNAEGLIVMLSEAEAIRQTLFRADEADAFRNKTVIQMSTIAPDESIAFKEEVKRRKGDYLEAPVLGSIPQVRAGELITMVGASKDQFAQWEYIFQPFSKSVHWVGSVGKAAALKLALNQLIASLTSAFSLSIGILQRNGVNVELFMEILRNSALYAPTFDKKLPRFVKGDYSAPNFPVKHLLKDVELVLKESKKAGSSTGLLEAVRDYLKVAMREGYEDSDYSAIFEAINPEED